MKATPVECYSGIYVKRDDLYEHGSGAKGAKARVVAALCRRIKSDYKGIVIAIARNSSIPAVVTQVAASYGLKTSIHTAAHSVRSPDLTLAEKLGAELHEHRPGYQSVINARANEQLKDNSWFQIPLGLECEEAVDELKAEVLATEWPSKIKRLIVPVGSGMMLSGILAGIGEKWGNKPPFDIVGICLGQDSTQRLRKWAPSRLLDKTGLIKAKTDFMKPAEQDLFPFTLDPYYEAKLVPFLKKGDMLWVVATRASLCES